VQTATLTRVGSLTIHTTFVTGMLNKLAQLLSHIAFLTYDLHGGSRHAAGSRVKFIRQAWFIFGVWFCYLSGAAIGTAGTLRWGIRTLIPLAILVTLFAVVDLIAPLAVEEEHDVSER
jgi:uncharacterized membrane protein YoaK (UPF0700 family)